MAEIHEYIDGQLNISGREATVARALAEAPERLYLGDGGEAFGSMKSAFAIALHQHQPLVPAGGHHLPTAALISNLQYMLEHPEIGDNHNAEAFIWCYKRIGEFVPQLFEAGAQPRVMLEYSGTLFHGLRQMGQHHVIDALKRVTQDPALRHGIEWLGCPWGHTVAPSTPTQDFALHVRAFQQHFAALFGIEALQRLRGFSPSEMALPNHPDVAYAFVKTLLECGYQWVLVQEHSVEEPESGHHPRRPHLPHRLVCQNSRGDTAEIVAIVKTQGSDTKLVAQMQPYYEAKSLDRVELAGRYVPPLVTQIADGENGGVMMNEFPAKFHEVMGLASWSETPAMNVSEYLEHLWQSGVREAELPALQPVQQRRIWERFDRGSGPQELAEVVEELKVEGEGFHMEGGSWTNDRSWVRGYDDVLGPMEQVSALFHDKVIARKERSDEGRYRNALLHLMASQTSCYRYWGQGLWTEYGKELCRRTREILEHDYR